MGELGLEPLISASYPVKLQEEKAEKWAGSQAWQFPLFPLAICPFNHYIFISLGHFVELSPGGPALFSETAAHLKKLELETVKAAGPWPALHININKVLRLDAARSMDSVLLTKL